MSQQEIITIVVLIVSNILWYRVGWWRGRRHLRDAWMDGYRTGEADAERRLLG